MVAAAELACELLREQAHQMSLGVAIIHPTFFFCR